MDGITFYGRYFNVITMNTQSQKVSMAEKIGYSLGIARLIWSSR